jgi:hypothetical protein
MMVVCSHLFGCLLSGDYIRILYVYLLNMCITRISPTLSVGLTLNLNLFDNAIERSSLH